MKNLMIIIFLIVTSGAAGQIETFGSKDSSGISSLIDLVTKNTKNKYHLYNKNTVHENAIEVIYTDGTHKLIFEFSPVRPINDHNSNVPDSVYFIFNSVTGLYKDVFPFWKKYYQHDAKVKSIQKAGNGKAITTPYLNGNMISGFNKYGDYWELENRYSGNK